MIGSMSTQILFDKLAYVDRLKAAGIDDSQARAHAEGLEQALRDEVATKADVHDLKRDLIEFKSDLKTEIERAKNAVLVAIISASFAIIGSLVALQKISK